MRWLGLVVVAVLLSGCGPAVPNEDLLRACRDARPYWRTELVTADAILLADDNTNALLLEPYGTPNTASMAMAFCVGCTRLLRRGFASVDWLPPSASNVDRVVRYTLASAGNAKCAAGRQYAPTVSDLSDAPPDGMCVAVEADVPRTARYAMGFLSTDFDRRGLSTSTYQLVDLQARRVVAQATEPSQIGLETPIYGCDAVGVHRASAREYVEEAIQPMRPAADNSAAH